MSKTIAAKHKNTPGNAGDAIVIIERLILYLEL